MLFTSTQLKTGNYYKVSEQNTLIKIIDESRHVRISYCRLFGMRVGIERNAYLNEEPVYEIISKYSFDRVKQLITNKINEVC